MALDTRIPLMSQGIQMPDFNAIAAQRQEQARNAFLMQRMQEQDAQQQEAIQRRQRAGAMVGSGDLPGARKTALEGGDFDLAEHIGGLDAEGHKAAMDRNKTLASLALGVSELPYEARRQAIAQSIPFLQQMGISPEQIESFDPTDENIAGIVATTRTLESQLAERAKAMEPYTLGKDQMRFVGSKEIARGPEGFETVNTPEGTVTTILRGGGAGGAPSPTGGVTGAAIESAATNLVPGLRVTSRQRSPQKNAMVGGVKNSYHITDQARDFVPPKGMSMGQLALTIKGSMPGFDVINEGDHVHVEPSRRSSAPSVIQGAPKRAKDAPSGYRWAASGNLEPIPGGPADPKGAGNRNTTSDRKAAADLRKEFDRLPEVQAFKDVRASYDQIRSIVANKSSTPQDDIALVFSFMKMLDPGSVVREGEFALAGKAAGLSDQVQIALQKVDSGQRLTPQQRQEMLRTAQRVYLPREAKYNQVAGQFQGYARDSGISPQSVAQRYLPPKKKAPSSSGAWGKASVVD